MTNDNKVEPMGIDELVELIANTNIPKHHNINDFRDGARFVIEIIKDSQEALEAGMKPDLGADKKAWEEKKLHQDKLLGKINDLLDVIDKPQDEGWSNWMFHGWKMDGRFDELTSDKRYILYVHNGMLIISDFEEDGEPDGH